jgi:hypothetical protein
MEDFLLINQRKLYLRQEGITFKVLWLVNGVSDSEEICFLAFNYFHSLPGLLAMLKDWYPFFLSQVRSEPAEHYGQVETGGNSEFFLYAG